MTDQPDPVPGDLEGPALLPDRPVFAASRPAQRSTPEKRLTPKERMAIARAQMPAQVARLRAANFAEVNLGYSAQLAMLEAERCLQCRIPVCIEGCPVRVNIPRFIELLRDGDLPGAADSLLADNALPCVTGRVCPQEIQCEGRCVRAKKGASVAIGALERFVADWAMANPATPKPPLPAAANQAVPRAVAIVGSGPAGLTAAGELVKQGYAVTIFEAFHDAGGVLIYGIPAFRLPKDIVAAEIARLVAAGVKIETNTIIGRTYTLAELRERFAAVFLAVGAGLPVFMNVPGENYKGVYSANEYLTRVNLMGAWQADSDTPVLRGHRVVVVGGGNVAMDAVRTAKRLGADEATIVYRRGRAELPARAEEVEHAEQEGIRFELQVAPLEVLGDENRWVSGLRASRMALGEPDASGRRRPSLIAGSEFVIPADLVVVAIGTRANPLLTASTPDLAINEAGYIVTDEAGMSSLPGVFAGGDIVRGAATVILAMGDGKRAAAAIDTWLRQAEASRSAPDQPLSSPGATGVRFEYREDRSSASTAGSA
jgi:glutamate synthase (NADPH/NADH) small chain